MNFLRFGLVQATRRRCTGSHEHGILLGADIVRHLRTEARARERLASRGRNLGQRYHQKEQPLKGKETRFHEVQDLEKSAEAPQAASLVPDQPTLSGESSVASYPEVGSSKPGVKTFRGLIIPQKPEPPADDECCMSGCAICVYDLYDESLEAYDQSLDALRTSLRGLAVPEDEWPATIRPQSQNSQKGTATETPTSTRGAVLSAFEEMERALKAKSEAARSKAESTGATNVAS